MVRHIEVQNVVFPAALILPSISNRAPSAAHGSATKTGSSVVVAAISAAEWNRNVLLPRL